MCEINCHGGTIITRQVLELCIQNGAVISEPGEFTKRAFLNGRIDLSQAEATIDIINAKTKKESKAAINQLEGFLSEQITKIRKKALAILVDIEASIDYPEYDIEEVTNSRALNSLNEIKEELEVLLMSFENGKIIKNGISTAIIGSPNSGKSSLLNAMLKEDRAIVTEIAGTTRDSIEETITIEGIPFKIIDTAGIRDSNNEVEKIGIERAKRIANDSDAIIAMFDISRELNKEEKEILEFIQNRKAIIILNKTDLQIEETYIDESALSIYGDSNKLHIIKMSVLNKEGLEELYGTLVEMFNLNEIDLDNEVIITNTRHKTLIEEANKNTCESIQAILSNMPIDIVAINIKDIVESLGKITGENVSEDIIMEIFSKFCLGK
jgi:tRNA modification GTPase